MAPRTLTHRIASIGVDPRTSEHVVTCTCGLAYHGPDEGTAALRWHDHHSILCPTHRQAVRADRHEVQPW